MVIEIIGRFTIRLSQSGPTMLATVLEHCLDQQGIQDNSAPPSDGSSSKSSLDESDEMVDGESTPAKGGTPESKESQEPGERANEPTKKVLPVEGNNFNLKVGKPDHPLYQDLI